MTGGVATKRLAELATGGRLQAKTKQARGSHAGHKREMLISETGSMKM